MSVKQQERPAHEVARQAAIDQVKAHEDALAKWTEEHERALAGLERLQGTAGATVLDDESAATRLPREMQEARDRADIAERAIAAAGPKLRAARQAAAMAEADGLGAPIAEARREVEEFDAKTARLLDALVKHTGARWEQMTIDRLIDRAREQDPGGAVRVEVPVPADRELRSRLAGLELRERVLRAAAAGESVREWFPELTWAQLPESLRPGGVMPQPGFADPVAGAEARLQEREAQLARESEELASIEERIARIEAEVREHGESALPYMLEKKVERLPELRRAVEQLKLSVVNLPASVDRERAAVEKVRRAASAEQFSA